MTKHLGYNEYFILVGPICSAVTGHSADAAKEAGPIGETAFVDYELEFKID